MSAKAIEVLIGGDTQAPKKPAKKQLAVHELILDFTRADRRLRSLLGTVLEEHGITIMEWLLLGVVTAKGTEGMYMGAIAEVLDITMSQVTALMNQLVAQHLVRQKTLRTDRRSRLVYASAKGRALLVEVEKELVVVNGWLKPIPETYLTFYWRVIQRMAHNPIPK